MRVGKSRAIFIPLLVTVVALLSAACSVGSSSEATEPGAHGASSRSSSRLASLLDSEGSGGHGSAQTSSDEHGAAQSSHESAGAAQTSSGGHDSGAAPAHGTQVHWSYQGAEGPSHWGNLADAFGTCTFGTSQSPIDIPGSIAPHATDIQFHYQPSALNILNNGHTLQVNYAPGSYIVLEGQQYQLLQFHFHTPSEHEIGSQSFPMEGHLVHKNSHDELAVVGVFIEEGHANPFFQNLVPNLPHQANVEEAVHGTSINIQEMLPANTSVYTYSGSLTTPPCSENVKWNVMSDPIQVSAQQIAAFASIMGHNNRPLQALHGRAVSGQFSSGPELISASAHGSAVGDSQAHSGPAHWEYFGAEGQRNWEQLSQDFTTCVDGSAQSPINISDPRGVPLENIHFNYHPTTVTVVNNGHTIQANVGQGGHGDAGYISVYGQQYQLLQFHFHWPSEHTVNGRQFFMEMHLVHQSQDGRLAVAGVLLERGQYNSLLEPIWNAMPTVAGGENASSYPLDVTALLPKDPRTYRYPGSLTTPPCSEGVRWMLFAEPVQVAPKQVEQFKNTIGYNARYTQPGHGREVLLDVSENWRQVIIGCINQG